jgi:D-glycero-alpha-D-manno-heptose 1-phosphate guanylyltransferase
MEAIVLAGGLGTRLAARLNNVPKPMAPVAGRPFLEILLNQLRRAGCTRALLSVGHLHEVIENHFGAEFGGMRVEYAIESAPLGTGGAIRAALEQAREDSVLVLNGDTFLDADYAVMLRLHGEESALLTMAVTRSANLARYGGVVIRGTGEGLRVAGFQEKGRAGAGWINAGAYVLNKDLRWPADLGEKFSFEIDFLAPHVDALAPAAFPVTGFFLDIGVPEDLDRAQTELAKFIVGRSGMLPEPPKMH